MKFLRIVLPFIFIVFSYATYVVVWGLHFPDDSPNIVYKRIGGSSGFRLNEMEKRKNLKIFPPIFMVERVIGQIEDIIDIIMYIKLMNLHY